MTYLKVFTQICIKPKQILMEPICKQYLDKLELPRISQMDKESLEAPLSLEELHVSLKSLQKGKSPGLDGLPPELYLEIWDLVGILMLNSFNFAIEHGAFHRDQKTSLISLLLKKEKDPLDCSSYRPISLIPCDLKIYAKIFASRLEKVIHSLIKEDQTGFIKGRNASDNMRRLLHILDFADSHPTPCAVFSLDAEKAFDRLEWNYMWAVLQCFGFGEHFVSMIKTLYHSPAASVITGNIISPSFPLQRGTRQGCPLSPLLFCLSLEPLAQAIRKSEVSIKIHDHNHSISLYADDIILYLDHFDVSVSSVIKEFDHFSSLSGYKINWGKSALMPINNVKVNFSVPSFIPIKESFIYLGITIYKNIHKIARDNFNNILVKVKTDIQRWKNLKVSLQGRISTVKMNLLPRFNFFFSMLPLSPPPGYFKEINSIILSLSGMINVPELNLPHYNILIAQEDWLYQILNYIIGRSSLRPFIIGLILNLQFHGGWLKLTRLNQIDFKIFYLLQNFVYQHLHILFFFNYVLLSKRMAFLGLLPFPLILCGTGLHHLLVGHLFP